MAKGATQRMAGQESNAQAGAEGIGGKAAGLGRLQAAGFSVPPYVVIRAGQRAEDLARCQNEFLEEGALYAVRSSASLEDSAATAMAGLFETFLAVPAEEVKERVAACFASARSRRVEAFLRARSIPWDGAMTVIVQRMVDPELSGILFTANPQGILNEMTAVVGFGRGDGVVADEVPLATFIHSFQDEVDLFAREEGAPEITPDLAVLLRETGRKLKASWDRPVDAEFALAEGRLWLLQARPITTMDLTKLAVLDSSNISESYPGLTLPLSIDFASEAYRGIFQNLFRAILGRRAAGELKPVLGAMVASSSGRMYYRIDNWYRMMKLLPLSGLYIPLWQEMMGVDHREVPEDTLSLPPLVRLAGILRLGRALWDTPGGMARLDRSFLAYRRSFQAAMAEQPGLPALETLYLDMRETLLGQWGVTLLNDVQAFVYTGALKKLRGGDTAIRPEALLSRIGQVESMKPLDRLQRIARLAPPEFTALRSEAELRAWLESGTEFAGLVKDYLESYGDRYLEELKLETRTFRTDPVLLQEWIVKFRREAGGPSKADPGEDPRTAGPGEMKFRGLTGWLHGRALRGIRLRESSRLNRTRAFGMARDLFLAAGEIHSERGSLAETRDVFWLKLDEVFQDDGRDFQALVRRRLAEEE